MLRLTCGSAPRTFRHSPGSGGLKQLFVGNPDGYTSPFAIRLGSIKVAVEPRSVLSDTIVVDEINIQDPEITLEGTLTGNNLSKILDNLNGSSATQEQQKNAPPPPGEKKQKKFIVKDLTLTGARVHLNLSAFGKSLGPTLPIPDLHLQNIGTGDGGVSAAELSRQILQPVLVGVVKAGADALANNALTDLGKKGGNDVKKAAAGILTNLFK